MVYGCLTYQHGHEEVRPNIFYAEGGRELANGESSKLLLLHKC